MRKSLLFVVLATVAGVVGCGTDAGSADVGASSSISGGTGGEGSGTGGGEAADNPAADAPNSNDTGAK
ncbi:MAG: hypothetical protein HY288_05995 [Planctomycetia bacterium]|nr:hypothetical protein [Planctomycetia bacterium]